MTKKTTKSRPQLQDLAKEKPKLKKKHKIEQNGLTKKPEKNSEDRKLHHFSPLGQIREFKYKKNQFSEMRNDRQFPPLKEEKKFEVNDLSEESEESKHSLHNSVFQQDWDSKSVSKSNSKDVTGSEFESHNYRHFKRGLI